MQNALRRTMNACSRRLVWCSVGGFLKTFPPPVRVLDECLVAVRDAVRHIPHYHHTAASPFRRRQSVRRHYYNIAMRVRVCARTRPVPPPPLGGAASCTRELILYCCRRVYYLYNIRSARHTRRRVFVRRLWRTVRVRTLIMRLVWYTAFLRNTHAKTKKRFIIKS